ncbi:MATE family efflux transporter, partial [Mediterraneibacter faecis]|uniref:MATE family efflux transporter n=1 Tax=Mediterraneibacter faecis TaxID=592978 RepID=UPI00210EB1D3
RTGVKLSELTALPFVILYFIFSRHMMGIFLGAESVEAISAGMAYLNIVSQWYFMIVIKLMTDGFIRGSGAMVYFV